MGLWRNNPETPEGKYPVVLRRDGTPLESRNIVLALKDPCVSAALMAYAKHLRDLANTKDCENGGWVCERYGWAREDAFSFAKDMEDLAWESDVICEDAPGDPGAQRHRKDDEVTLAWARSMGCPGS